MKTDQLNELASALVKAQSEFSTVPKDAENPFFKSKYADLAAVVKTAGPVLAKHGLAISQYLSRDEEGNSTLITYLMHESGQYIAHEMSLMLTKPDPQSQGSATTYARRYSYMAALGLVADEDDDGNHASRPAEHKQSTSTGTASDKQVELIKDLLKKKGVTRGADIKLLFDAWLDKPFLGFSAMNKDDASDLIEGLMNSASLHEDLLILRGEDQSPDEVAPERLL